MVSRTAFSIRFRLTLEEEALVPVNHGESLWSVLSDVVSCLFV